MVLIIFGLVVFKLIKIIILRKIIFIIDKNCVVDCLILCKFVLISVVFFILGIYYLILVINLG